MESLRFAQMNIRQGNISRTHSDSCEWLFAQPEYLNWRKPELKPEHCGFLWIKAKPGSGKSTLMNFLLTSAKKQLPYDTTIAFFFHARGDRLQRSLEGMYRSLLHQLLTEYPLLLANLKSLRLDQTAPQVWSVDSLCSLFHEAILSLEDVRLTCFIDALDECPEDEIRHLFDALGHLSHAAANTTIDFHVCFASRHYPHITMDNCQHLTLDGQEGHKQDISNYVNNKLAGKGRVISDIRTEVQARAQGVFLWAALVVHILNKEHDRGSNAHQLRLRLNEIPNGLHELFQDILQRGVRDDGTHENLLRILQWVLYAQRPMSPEELYFAIHSGDSDPAAFEAWSLDEIEPQTIDLFILNSSKGLTEVARGNAGQERAVQFIHESVRDYLREAGFGALSISLNASAEGSAHSYLYQCCSNLLTSKVPDHALKPPWLPEASLEEARAFRSTASKLFPFLKYSAYSVIYHAEKAQSNSTLQFSCLKTFPVSTWGLINNMFARYDQSRYTAKLPTKASVFALSRAQTLLALELDQSASLSPLAMESALESAYGGDSPEAFAMLFNKMMRSLLSVTDIPISDDHLDRHLKIADSWEHDVDAVKLLFGYFRRHLTTRHPQHADYVLAAAHTKQVDIFSPMLEQMRHTEPAQKQSSVVEALHSAARNGDDAEMQVLIAELGVMRKMRCMRAIYRPQIPRVRSRKLVGVAYEKV
jgi:hypothetical protein